MSPCSKLLLGLHQNWGVTISHKGKRRTGRSPDDRFIVDEPGTTSEVAEAPQETMNDVAI